MSVSDIEDGKLDDKYVLSSRIRCGRSIEGFPFSPTTRRGQRREVEAILRKALEGLSGTIAGLLKLEVDRTMVRQPKQHQSFTKILE